MANPDYQAMTFFARRRAAAHGGAGGGVGVDEANAARVVNGRGLPRLGQLGARNAARNPTRSLLTAALLAAAAFLLVAVESFRRQPGSEFLEKTGGSGGFNLIAETDVPLFQPFDDRTGPRRTSRRSSADSPAARTSRTRTRDRPGSTRASARWRPRSFRCDFATATTRVA